MTLTTQPSETNKSYIPVKLLEGETIKVPVYSVSQLEPLRCSAYVRMAADELFGKRFSKCHAWDRKYYDNTITSLNGKTTLKSLLREGVLQRGMVVGIHNPGSEFLATEDMEGRPVEYTHMALFIGRNLRRQPLLADQFERAVTVRTEQEMRNIGLTPIQIFDSWS